MTFTSSEKKIAFAASFGVTDFDDSKRTEIASKLKDFKAISVRENSAKDILEQMNISAETIIDPTMVVPIEHWKKCEKKVEGVPKDYILVYVLQKNTKEIKEKIEKIAQKEKLPIVNIFDKNSPEYYAYDPFEFLWLIEHAKLVCTDSFHASVFSILLETPFIVYGRAGMNSRITTLLGKFNLESRMSEYIDYDNLYEINFESRDKVLEEEKINVYRFLDKAFN